jgi:C1A family cysteine protease
MDLFSLFRRAKVLEKWSERVFKTAVALILTPTAIGALNAQEPEIKLAPLNPAFVKWQAAQKERRALMALGYTEPNENRFGYIPEPMLIPAIDRPATQIEAMVKAGLASYQASFDLRTQDFLTPVRNQNPFGTCWAFASLASMESNIKVTMGTSLDFSEWHLAWFTYNPLNNLPAFTKDAVESGENETFDQGGNTTRAIAIMTRGTGPVSESSAPYQNNKYYLQNTLPNGTEPTAATIKNAYMFTTSNPDTIKGLLTTNGAVAISMYWPDPDYEYYNSLSKAFRYVQYVQPEELETNHMVNIVGWDDNFPSASFPASNRPNSDGAWIIRNSWGSYWGEAGYFYMSYDTSNGWVASYEADFEIDRKIYQYDLLGKLGSVGYGRDTAWFSNVFTASGTEEITDIAFYTSANNSSFTITIKTGVTGNPSTGVQVGSQQQGTTDMPGYHRIKLNSPVRINSGDKFAVIVRLTEQQSDSPVGVLWPYNGYTESVTASRGVGWISSNGSAWTDIYQIGDTDNISICLKAFTVSASASVSVTVEPSTATMVAGSAKTFTATVTGGSGNRNVTWSASGGTITQSGAYTAPATPGTYTITATSAEDITKTGTATVTVIPAISVSITPVSVTLSPGGTRTFTATVTGGSGNKNVTWSASGGVITQSGIYTAPATPGTYTITATSAEDTTKTGTATVTVIAAISVSITPVSVTLSPGGTQTFTATVTGGFGNTNVGWAVISGLIYTNGNECSYTAPATPGTYTITATSVEDITKTGTATVTVIAAGIAITNPPKGLITGDTATFQANVTGLSNSAVTWSASAGNINSATGLFNAPATAQKVTITATSVELPTIKVTTDVKISSVNFDGNSKTAPQLLDLANAIYSESQADLEKYDLNGDGKIDNEDIKILFNKMGW